MSATPFQCSAKISLIVKLKKNKQSDTKGTMSS